MLLFVVARTRLDRYAELRRQFDDWRDVRIVLDRREGVGHGSTPFRVWTGGEWSDAIVSMSRPT